MATSSTSSTSSTSDPAPKSAEQRPYVWVPADHALQDHHVERALVAVDADTGVVLDPQPTYPEQNKADLEPHDSLGVEPPAKPAA